MRAAVYARFSTERQRESSIADQFRLCQADARFARVRIATLEAEVERLVDAIAAVGVSPALRERLQRAEADLAAARGVISAAGRSGPSIDPDQVVTAYRELVLDLGAAVAGDMARAREILRELLGRITITVDDVGTWAEMETTPAAQVAAGASLGVVAGARFVFRRRFRIS